MSTVVDAPVRADDLVLLGTMVGSGYRTPPALVRRGDGQTLQLTPLLYAVLDAVDGRRTCGEIASVVRESVRRDVSADTVADLVDRHLRPLGLVKLADGSEPSLRRSNPLLGLRLKFAATDPQLTRRLTDPFRVLFRPVMVAVVLSAFLAITWWVFFDKGLGPAAYDAFQRPHLLLLVFAVTVLSGGFHEFGHAAAARYGGAQPGVIGGGLYLVWPAFYTDVTDSYRLSRRGRLRTDLGGLYFNAIVVVLTFACWSVTHWDAVLLLVATQTLQMVQQLMPTMRFDGYHVLADLTGVPDLYHRIKPTLLGLLPHRWSDPGNRALKPWARVVITAWVLVTIPLMAFTLLAMVTSLPRVLGTAWASVQSDAGDVGAAWRTGNGVDVTANALQVLAVALPVLGGLLVIGRFGRRWIRSLARWSMGSPLKRAAAIGLATVVVTGLAWAWAPRPGSYRPISQGEKGLLTAALPGRNAPVVLRAPTQQGRAAGGAARQRLASGQPLHATFEAGQQLPTSAHPQLAVVLVPSSGSGSGSGGGSGGASAPAQAGQDEPWVFPFSRPLPPGTGDNQAAAYNTGDNTTMYDVAFALVWATGDEVDNVNAAYAYASCSNCVTVAVAFQVVLIMDDAHVVVPQNLAVAANYDCYKCITAAVASQLVLSVEHAPGDEQLLALASVWNRLLTFGQSITSSSLDQISTQLQVFKEEITAILAAAPAVSPSSSATVAPVGSSAAPVGEPSPSGSTDGGSSTPTASSASSPGASPDAGGSTGSAESTGSTDSTGSSSSTGAPDATSQAPADTASSTASPEPASGTGSGSAGSP
ncbi:hypothetical protein JCM18899A_29150 [Nocardioides sp. AN3]